MNWPRARLGDHVEILSGFAFKSENFNTEGRGLPLVRIRDVVRGRSETFFDGSHPEKFVISDGDILVGMDGEFNTARWCGGPALLNQRVCRLSPQSSMSPEYLFRFLPSALQEIEDRTPSVTVKHLSVKDIREISTPLPPLAEQQRIAAILDQADDLRRKRKAALERVRNLKHSLLGALVEATGGSRKVKLADISMRITDGTHQAPDWVEAGVPFIFVSNVRNGEISLATNKFVSPATYATLTRSAPIELGDVLYTAVGSYGHSAVVETEEPFLFQRHVAHIKPNRQKVRSAFLAPLLESPVLRRQADRVAKGVAQKTVTLADLKAFEVALPTLDQQDEFVRRASEINRLKDLQDRHLVYLDSLFTSLQHRAFRGEL